MKLDELIADRKERLQTAAAQVSEEESMRLREEKAIGVRGEKPSLAITMRVHLCTENLICRVSPLKSQSSIFPLGKVHLAFSPGKIDFVSLVKIFDSSSLENQKRCVFSW